MPEILPPFYFDELSNFIDPVELKKKLYEIKITTQEFSYIKEKIVDADIASSTVILLTYILYNNGFGNEIKKMILSKYKRDKESLLFLIEDILYHTSMPYFKMAPNKDDFIMWCFKEMVPELAKLPVYRRSSGFIRQVIYCFERYQKLPNFKKYINATPKKALEDICANPPCAVLFIHHDEVQQNPEYINKAIQHGTYVSKRAYESVFTLIPDLSFNSELLTPKTAYDAIEFLFPGPCYKNVGDFNVDVFLKKARLYALTDPDKLHTLREYEKRIKAPDKLYRLIKELTNFGAEKVVKTIVEMDWNSTDKVDLILIRTDFTTLLDVEEDILEANAKYGHLVPFISKVLKKLKKQNRYKK